MTNRPGWCPIIHVCQDTYVVHRRGHTNIWRHRYFGWEIVRTYAELPRQAPIYDSWLDNHDKCPGVH